MLRESVQNIQRARDLLKALETTTAMKRRKISCSVGIVDQQDTREYLIIGVPKSEFWGESNKVTRGDKGGGEEGKTGRRGDRA